MRLTRTTHTMQIGLTLWANGWSPNVNGFIPTDQNGVPIAFFNQADAIKWWADLDVTTPIEELVQ